MKKATTLLILAGLWCQFNLCAQVVINEFSAANFSNTFDYYGEFEDWIELYNTGTSSVDLSGYFLSDRTSNPDKWEIPNGTTIPANGYLLIWASDRDEFDGLNLHTSFKITQTKTNEDVVLANPSGTIIDSHLLETPNQTNHSWGRTEDGGDTWGVLLNPTPGAKNVGVQASYAAKPAIFPAAGFYAEPITVSIDSEESNSLIYYTLDGSTPSASSIPYTSPFIVSATSVVKAIVISNDVNIPNSFVDFHTFYINETHTVPVISISGEDLPNLLNGDDFARPPGYFELFMDGERVADATGEYNKHGNDSWAYAQRGIDFITRDQFGDDHAVKHAIFPHETDRDQFQRLILKAAANDNYSFETGGAHIRDAYIHTLSQLADLEMDERTYKPCVLYLNGEYWGVYEIREKVDDNDYTDYHYNQGRKWIDFIKTWGITWEEYGSWDDWYTLTDYITANDMSDPVHYEYVSDRLNVNSLIDYFILHSHNVSSDWLNWNTAWWRGRKPSGGAKKWRYILWDEDATFGHYINYSQVPDESPDADPCNPEAIPPDVDFEGHIALFSDLSENEEFFATYINRYADLNNTYFRCDFMIPLLDSLIGVIEPEMPRQIDRWGGSMEGWQENIQALKDFIETRCTIIEESIVDCYEDEGIMGPYQLLINVEPEGAGKVQANSIVGITYPWDATYYGGIDINLTAIPEQGHQFLYWEVANTTFAPDQFAEAISMSLESNDEITAFFSGAVPCIEPFNLVVDPTFTSIALNWTGAANAISYEVRYRETGAEEWDILSNIDPEISLFGLSMCTDYELELRSFCQNSLSAYSNFTISTSCVTDTESPELLAEVQAYPNPFKDQLTIDIVLSQASPVTLRLFNALGQQVYAENRLRLTSGQHQFQLQPEGNLLSGVYSLSIETEQERKTQLLVKM